MKPIFIVLIVMLGVALLFSIFFYRSYKNIMWQINNYPEDNPYNFVKNNDAEAIEMSTKKRIVFAGDSITHGNLSENYITTLANILGTEKYDYINAGMNSELAYNLYKRIDSIIACKPDFVTILIGTNDAHRELELFDEKVSEERLNLPQKPTKEWFRENLEKIVSELQEKTKAKIALCSIPPLGEDSEKDAFKQTIKYSEIIWEISRKFGVKYLPVNDRMIDYLYKNPSSSKFSIENRLIEKAAMKHFLMGRCFDKISQDYGFTLLTDNIHLNSIGAKIIADLIGDFIES